MGIQGIDELSVSNFMVCRAFKHISRLSHPVPLFYLARGSSLGRFVPSGGYA